MPAKAFGGPVQTGRQSDEGVTDGQIEAKPDGLHAIVGVKPDVREPTRASMQAPRLEAIMKKYLTVSSGNVAIGESCLPLYRKAV